MPEMSSEEKTRAYMMIARLARANFTVLTPTACLALTLSILRALAGVRTKSGAPITDGVKLFIQQTAATVIKAAPWPPQTAGDEAVINTLKAVVMAALDDLSMVYTYAEVSLAYLAGHSSEEGLPLDPAILARMGMIPPEIRTHAEAFLTSFRAANQRLATR